MEFPFVMFSALIFSTDVLFFKFIYLFLALYLFPLCWNVYLIASLCHGLIYGLLRMEWVLFRFFFCVSILLNLSNHLGHYVVDQSLSPCPMICINTMAKSLLPVGHLCYQPRKQAHKYIYTLYIHTYTCIQLAYSFIQLFFKK